VSTSQSQQVLASGAVTRSVFRRRSLRIGPADKAAVEQRIFLRELPRRQTADRAFCFSDGSSA
jgi:hypothetical protein